MQIHILLTLALVDGSGQLHAPAALSPGKEPPGTHGIGRWVDVRAGLDDLEKIKFLTLPGLELRPSVVQPVATRLLAFHIALLNSYKYKHLFCLINC
jgi:hypothetical protein